MAEIGGLGGGAAPANPARRPHCPLVWNISAVSWCAQWDKWYLFAVGNAGCPNRVYIMSLDEIRRQILPVASLPDDDNTSKVMFLPEVYDSRRRDLLATSSDNLRIWSVYEDAFGMVDVVLCKTLGDRRRRDLLTSFDWNEDDYRRIVTSSVDSSCTVWDITSGDWYRYTTPYLPVNDISWGSPVTFASASSDGAVRLFDTRCTTRVLIAWVNPRRLPIVRVEWNKLRGSYVAAVVRDNRNITVLDIRYPELPTFELRHHRRPVNAIAWSPVHSSTIYSCSEDGRVSKRDVSWGAERDGDQNAGSSGDAPPGALMSYDAGYAVKLLEMYKAHPQSLVISSSRNLEFISL